MGYFEVMRAAPPEVPVTVHYAECNHVRLFHGYCGTFAEPPMLHSNDPKQVTCLRCQKKLKIRKAV